MKLHLRYAWNAESLDDEWKGYSCVAKEDSYAAFSDEQKQMFYAAVLLLEFVALQTIAFWGLNVPI